jgi:aminopeptidase N
MTKNTFARSFLAGTFIFLMAFSGVVRATPMPGPFSGGLFDDDKHRLPPVNWVRSRKVDVKNIALDMHFDWTKDQAVAIETITVAPFADADRFTLDAALMSIDSITLPNGNALKYNYAGKSADDNLEIILDRVYKSGEDVSVKIAYKTNYVDVPGSGNGILGGFGEGLRFVKPTADNPNKPRQIWSQGETEFNRYWFPSYDSPNDFRTTDFRFTVDEPFSVVSNGKLVETKKNKDGTRTFHWVMDQPYSNYLSSVVVSETTPVVQNFEGIPVYGYGYTNETKEVAATVKNLPATMKFFSDITGVKYPYPKYSQAFVEDFGGGMENISATTQIEEMIHDERELLDRDSEGLQSHELAHQWFGDYVTCREWGQIWLNESFATYMQAMWDEKLKGHDEFLYSDVRGNQDQTIGTWKQNNRRPIVTKYYESKDAIFDTYAYPGGGSVLHMLRKHVGDELFFKSLHKYLTDNAHQPVSTEDLRIAFEETTGQSMDWFFDEWLYKMGHPIFEVTQAYDAGKLTLNVKQTQKVDITNEYPQTEFFQGYVDIEVDGSIHRVWLDPKAENVFTFDSATKPMLVNFDYEGTWLKELKFDKSADDLLYQMKNDKDVLGRRWAMGELAAKAKAGTDKDRIVTAFLESAEKDPFWRVRRAAVTVVADMFSPDQPRGQTPPAVHLPADVQASMLRLAKDEQPLVRAEAIQLLGESSEPRHADLYMSALTDRSYGVIDVAAEALARTKDPRAFDALTKLTTTPSWKGRIAIAGLNALSELGDKRGFDTGYKVATDTTQAFNIRTSALRVVGALGKGDPRAYPLIFEKFKTAFDSGNIPALNNTIRAIVRIADPRGQEAFDMLKMKYKDSPGGMQQITFYETQFKAAIGKP